MGTRSSLRGRGQAPADHVTAVSPPLHVGGEARPPGGHPSRPERAAESLTHGLTSRLIYSTPRFQAKCSLTPQIVKDTCGEHWPGIQRNQPKNAPCGRRCQLMAGCWAGASLLHRCHCLVTCSAEESSRRWGRHHAASQGINRQLTSADRTSVYRTRVCLPVASAPSPSSASHSCAFHFCKAENPSEVRGGRATEPGQTVRTLGPRGLQPRRPPLGLPGGSHQPPSHGQILNGPL